MNNLFTDQIINRPEYQRGIYLEGDAEAFVANNDIMSFRGKGTLHVSPIGEWKLMMQIEEIGYFPNPAEAAIHPSSLQFTKVRIECRDAVVEMTDDVQTGESSFVFRDDWVGNLLEFSSSHVWIEYSSMEKIAAWSIPITNFSLVDGNRFPVTFPAHEDTYRIHRVPSPDLAVGAASEDSFEIDYAILNSDHRLKNYSYENLRDYILFGILPTLSFLQTSMVGCPWVDLWDSSGRIIRRLVCGWRGDKQSGPKRIIIWKDIQRFLTCSFESSVFATLPYRVALNRVVRSEQDSGTLEDAMFQIFTILDKQGNLYKVRKKPRSSIYTSETRQMIDEFKNAMELLFQGAANKLRAQNSDQQEMPLTVQILEKIARRSRTIDEWNIPFGDMVVELVGVCGFLDNVVMDKYCKNLITVKPVSWSRSINTLRNRVMHEGYIGVQDVDGLPMGKLYTHLKDIVIRIMLKTVKYDGNYVSPIDSQSHDLNWVKENTTFIDLGYVESNELDTTYIRQSILFGDSIKGSQ